MNQQELNKYFDTVWESKLDTYQYSGWSLKDKINFGERVLDVGCGFNEFKPHIPNLIGIDPATEMADFKVSIENFRTDKKFDVAFCLGSINFGDDQTIVHQIQCVVDLLKPKSRIYWRCNPGFFDHDNDECTKINFYPWTFEKQIEFCKRFDYQLVELKWDINKQRRIYAEWRR